MAKIKLYATFYSERLEIVLQLTIANSNTRNMYLFREPSDETPSLDDLFNISSVLAVSIKSNTFSIEFELRITSNQNQGCC